MDIMGINITLAPSPAPFQSICPNSGGVFEELMTE